MSYSITSSENWTIIVHEKGTFFSHGGTGSYEELTIHEAANRGEPLQKILETAQNMNELSKEESLFWNRAFKESAVQILRNSNITKEVVEFVARSNLHVMVKNSRAWVVGYKAVNENLTDIYSGKTQYTVGKSVLMKKKEVDFSDMDCSKGLHLGSFKYAKRFQRTAYDAMLLVATPAEKVAHFGKEKLRTYHLKVLAKISQTDKINGPLKTLIYEGEKK